MKSESSLLSNFPTVILHCSHHAFEASASDPPPTVKCSAPRGGLCASEACGCWSAGWFPSTPLCCRNQSPRRHLSVRLSGGKAGQCILGGRLWWRIGANIFCLVGVKPPTSSFSCNHGSHWQSLYYCIDLEERNSFVCYQFLATRGKHGCCFHNTEANMTKGYRKLWASSPFY